MDISPADPSPSSAHDPASGELHPTYEHEVGHDAELEAFLAAERTANDYHPD
ncbi:hypothetical protein [Actinomycetospora atypica]|uniref:Uncharacterized protein n=1 Tax=Actinomycetospora atypica TaxID=1290095 RepID=A0ABV9YKI1_9PSEU